MMPTKRKTVEAEAADKSLSVVEEESLSSEVTFAENKKKENIVVKSSPSQIFSSNQGKFSDLSVGLLFQKRLLHFCNAHKQEVKRRFPGERLSSNELEATLSISFSAIWWQFERNCVIVFIFFFNWE